jgi:hypothetical protein
VAEKEKTIEERRKEAANAAADALDADIYLFNYEVWPPVDFTLIRQVAKRRVRKNLILILVTEGGSSDSAFRIMRAFQGRYDRITAVVSGWCKSAGTLMCIGANSLQIGDLGEMGPLDVQIVKADEMDEEKSGLAADAAFEKLQQEAFKLFCEFVRDIGQMEYRITLKTAAEISRHVTVGLMSPIFEKLDPVTIGEDYRSNRLALAYAERLNVKAKNLVRRQDFDALEQMLSGYQSHGFVIDRTEAENLFRIAKPICAELTSVIELLGSDAIIPRNSRRRQEPRLEYLNDEPPEQPPAAAGPDGTGTTGSGDGTNDLPGNPEAGSGAAPSPPEVPDPTG